MKHAILKFGDRVNVTDKYYRSSPTMGQRVWRRIPYEKEDCIYLGLRLLQNGEVNFNNYNGHYFEPKEYFKAALVCPNENTNPVYVPLDCIKSVKFDKWY